MFLTCKEINYSRVLVRSFSKAAGGKALLNSPKPQISAALREGKGADAAQGIHQADTYLAPDETPSSPGYP